MSASGEVGYFQLTALRKMKCSPIIFLKLVFIKNKNLCDLFRRSAAEITLVNNCNDKTES